MSSIEDRLRAATRAAADTVPSNSQPPLRLPSRVLGLGRGAGVARLRLGAPPRLMASAAAAVAMIAVAATAVGVREFVAGGGPGNGGASAPSLFVATVAVKNSPGQPAGRSDAVLGRTAGGTLLARIRPPAPYNSFSSVSAAADDRTFVLAAQKLPKPPSSPGVFSSSNGPTRLYLLRIHPHARHPVTLRPLPIPVFPGSIDFVQIALSPSGTRLAVDLEPSSLHSSSILSVYDVATGRRSRTWTLPAVKRAASPGINTQTWDGGDQFLVTLVYANRPRSCRAGCLQLLDTTHQGGHILADSKTIFRTSTIHKFVALAGLVAYLGRPALGAVPLGGASSGSGLGCCGRCACPRSPR